MICALLVLAPRPQTVSFTHPCAHSSVVLAALGEKLGEKIVPGGSVLKDYFAIKLTDQPIEEAKRVIAETLNAKWVQRGDYLVLDRGPVQEAEERQALDNALRRRVEEYLQQHPKKTFDAARLKRLALDAIGAGKSQDTRSQEMRAVMAAMPDAIWSPEIVRAIGMDRILGLDEGASVRYSTDPKQEAPMPSDVKKTLEGYVADSVAARDVLTEVGLGLRTMTVSKELQLDLSVYRGSGTVTVSLLVKNKPFQGVIVGEFGSNEHYFIATIGSSEKSPSKPNWPALTGPFAPGEPAASLIRVASHRRRPDDGSVRPITETEWDTAIKAALDQEKADILALYGALPLEKAAEQWKRDYVAVIDDAQATYAEWCTTAERAMLAQVWQAWGNGLNVGEDAATGIIKVYPNAPKAARENRFDRAAVSRFARSFAENGRVTLDAAADLAASSNTLAKRFANGRAAFLLLPVSGGGWGHEALSVYGALNSGQKRLAEQDGLVIDFANLPSTARETIQTALAERGKLYSEEPPDPVRWTTLSVSISRGAWKNNEVGIKSIPPDAKVRILCWRTTGIQPKTPIPENDEGIYTPEQYARYGAKGAVRSEGDTGPSRPDDAPVAILDAERVQVEVYIPGLGYTAFLSHTSSRTERTPFVPIDKLNEPWKTQLAEAIKKLGGGSQPHPCPRP